MPSPWSRRVLAGLVLGALLRALLLPGPGSPDVGSWKLWTFAGAWDATGLYGVGGEPPERGLLRWGEIQGTTEYPPLMLYEMAAVGRIYREIDPAFRDSTLLTVLVKLPGLFAELAFVLGVLVWGPRVLGSAAAVWTAMAIWLNPAILVSGAGLGYLDAEMAMPAALALLAAGGGHPAIAGVLMAAALLTKAQALFVLPVVMLAALGRDRSDAARAMARFAAAGAVTAAAIVMPVVVRGAFPNMVQALGRLAAHDMVSGYGLNLWWVVTWIVRSSYAAPDLGWVEAFSTPVRILQISRMQEVGLPNPKPLGTLLVLAAIGWLLWRGRAERSLQGLAWLGGSCVFAYFLLGVQVHENHLYLAVPFMAVAGGLDPARRRTFWALSMFTFFNMYIFYGLGDGAPPLVDRRWTGIDLTVLVALAACAKGVGGVFHRIGPIGARGR
jgi:hypothetical protein